REAAERANRARDDFFAMLSHELRSPLMAILGWTALLKSDRLNEEDGAAVELIERNARIQRRLIDDLLDMARIVTGRMRVELRPLPCLSELIRLVIDSFKPIALAKSVSVLSRLEPEAGPIEGDPERLQQVLWNLLANAIRFTPAGGRIEVRCVRTETDVEVQVSDSGRGIRAEAVPHLFERYWQGQFDSHPGQGLGLGLAIAHRIVSLHSGTICAASAGEGQGATFTVRLPLSHLVPGPQSSVPLSLGARIADAAAAAADESQSIAPEALESLSPVGGRDITLQSVAAMRRATPRPTRCASCSSMITTRSPEPVSACWQLTDILLSEPPGSLAPCALSRTRALSVASSTLSSATSRYLTATVWSCPDAWRRAARQAPLPWRRAAPQAPPPWRCLLRSPSAGAHSKMMSPDVLPRVSGNTLPSRSTRRNCLQPCGESPGEHRANTQAKCWTRVDVGPRERGTPFPLPHATDATARGTTSARTLPWHGRSPIAWRPNFREAVPPPEVARARASAGESMMRRSQQPTIGHWSHARGRCRLTSTLRKCVRRRVPAAVDCARSVCAG